MKTCVVIPTHNESLGVGNLVNCLKQNDTRIIAEPLFSLPSSASAEEKQPLDKAKLTATCGGEAQDTGKQARNCSYTDHIARLRR